MSFDSPVAGESQAAGESPAAGGATLVCIPTYNERENIGRIVPAVLQQLPLAHVLVVDDNSPDGTGELADAIAAADARVHVLHRAGKQGLGRAYLAAFSWALQRDYQFIVQFDADFSHDPAYLPQFLALLQQGVDVVVGSRRVRGGGVRDWGRLRRFVSWGGSVYARRVLGVAVRDLTGGFNAFSRKALEGIDLGDVRSNGYCFQIELKFRACRFGFRVQEAPIIFSDRKAGVSKMNSSIIMEAIVNVARLRRLGRHWPSRPLTRGRAGA